MNLPPLPEPTLLDSILAGEQNEVPLSTLYTAAEMREYAAQCAAAAVVAEREACARICDENIYERYGVEMSAKEIRARGTTRS